MTHVIAIFIVCLLESGLVEITFIVLLCTLALVIQDFVYTRSAILAGVGCAVIDVLADEGC